MEEAAAAEARSLPYVMSENTNEGHDAVNEFRVKMGLEKISKHWHNLYFNHDHLMRYLESRFHFVAHHPFDLYYLITRVFMNQIAMFKGFGKDAVKDPIFEKADPAARQLYEAVGTPVKVDRGPSFGAIQGFVVRKMSDE